MTEEVERTYTELERNVERWASDRKIIQHSNVLAQAKKTLEEAGELVEAAAQIQVLNSLPPMTNIEESEAHLRAMDAYRDALGDVLVTLIVGSATAKVDLLECLDGAYNTIKDRKGYLKPDGTFVKVE